jgi:hypothetical protein
MILEGIVTTISGKGTLNVAPMGPTVDEGMQAFVLRPYRTARTYENLKEHPEGVLHVTDDVLLLARAAIGALDQLPKIGPARHVCGFVLNDCCRYYEFRIDHFDEAGERASFHARVVHSEQVRDFFGFNRAKHAVVEAAILASRIHLLPASEIQTELDKFETIVRKTGGTQESDALSLLRRYVSQRLQVNTSMADSAR